MADQITGIGVSPGVAAGPVARMAPPLVLPTDAGASADPAAESQKVREALEAVASELDRRAANAKGAAKDVLGAQAMMARDPSLAGKAAGHVEAGASAVRGITLAFGEFREVLAAAGPYMAERVADLDDLRDRALAAVLGVPMPEVPKPGHPFVLVAHDLSPADTATLDPTQVLAIITEGGGPTSHTAILAKMLGVPAVVAAKAAIGLRDGDTALVDGDAGTIVAGPDPELVASRLKREADRKAALASLSGPGKTADGHSVQLLVNIAGSKDLARASQTDAEGVGLFRTEFLFLDRPEAPSIEEQTSVYASVLQAFAGRKVVFRTLDAGADKPLAFVTVADEPNPALGVRGLRTARRHPQLLENQLTAISRAASATKAEPWVMAPMVSTPAEADEFTQLVRDHGVRTAGAMVEVPAAAIRAKQVLQHCDFLSIGTNDLAQYTFAADRMEGELAELLDPWQPALLELIRLTGEAGREVGKPVGVCGEAASDALLAIVLVGLGVTSLSMAPVAIPEVRANLAQHTLEDCQRLARLALSAEDGRAARAAVREQLG